MMGTDAAGSAANSAQNRLEFVDGIRGLAALYIVLYHALLAVIISGWGGGLHPLVYGYTAWMQFGNLGVAVFIVLSGFCLMVPVARSNKQEISGGIRAFLVRRGRRILPPYYVGIALSALLVLALPALGTPSPRSWHNFALPVWDTEVILSHLFLVHNLNPEWALKINPSLWTIGTEVQLYLLFCLVLIPVWKRFGMFAMLGAGFGVGLVPLLFARNPGALPSPWYTGLFALGMAAAMVAYSEGRVETWLRERASWSGICTIFCLLVALVNAWGLENGRGSHSYSNLILGAALASLLIHGTRCGKNEVVGREPGLMRFLRSKPLAFLGAISYSLYVIHEPALRAMHVYMHKMGASPLGTYMTLLGVGVPLCVGLAYAFHCAVERPFQQDRKEKAAEPRIRVAAPARMPLAN